MLQHFRGTTEVDGRRTKPRVGKATWNQRIGYWLRFLRFGEKNGFVDEIGYDLEDVRQRGRSDPLIRALLPDEFRSLIDLVPTQRLRAGMNVLAGTGMRSSENAALTIADVPPLAEFAGSSYRPRVIVGKGDKKREILWPFTAAKSVWAYHRIERSLAVDELSRRIIAGQRSAESPVLAWGEQDGVRVLRERDDAPLWLREDGEPLSPKRWGKEFTSIQKSVGTRVSPHWLRHTYAVVTLSNLIKQQIRIEIAEAKLGTSGRREYFRSPLDEVRRRLGHSSIETTMVYLDHVAEHRHLLHLAIRDMEDGYLDA
nr:tyrosine-type recombinase/integrase [Sphingomonas sp. IC-56]